MSSAVLVLLGVTACSHSSWTWAYEGKPPKFPALQVPEKSVSTVKRAAGTSAWGAVSPAHGFLSRLLND